MVSVRIGWKDYRNRPGAPVFCAKTGQRFEGVYDLGAHLVEEGRGFPETCFGARLLEFSICTEAVVEAVLDEYAVPLDVVPAELLRELTEFHASWSARVVPHVRTASDCWVKDETVLVVLDGLEDSFEEVSHRESIVPDGIEVVVDWG